MCEIKNNTIGRAGNTGQSGCPSNDTCSNTGTRGPFPQYKADCVFGMNMRSILATLVLSVITGANNELVSQHVRSARHPHPRMRSLGSREDPRLALPMEAQLNG